MERKGRPPAAQSQLNLLPPAECQRQLEFLCAIVRGLTSLGDKLDDLNTLNQQQADLIRRLLERTSL